MKRRSVRGGAVCDVTPCPELLDLEGMGTTHLLPQVRGAGRPPPVVIFQRGDRSAHRAYR